ncbi:hypothetical protein [Endozoicomonas sp. ALB115]|uniref:hypothetical protein n=1 Tax=Endozoicomonas sp. ALB115 TaxID=3403074 RepID=UPI003BB70A5E
MNILKGDVVGVEQLFTDLLLGDISEELIDELLFTYTYLKLDSTDIVSVLQNRIAEKLPIIGKCFEYREMGNSEIKKVIGEEKNKVVASMPD